MLARSGDVTLAEAQEAFGANWVAVYRKYVGD